MNLTQPKIKRRNLLGLAVAGFAILLTGNSPAASGTPLQEEAGTPPAPAETQGMHPSAPKETAQFAFLIGEWVGHEKIGDGKLNRRKQLVWKGDWILDGLAIQNTSRTTVETGEPGVQATVQFGVDTRVYNPSLGKWQHSYVDGLTGMVLSISWEKKGRAMISNPVEWNVGGRTATHIIKFRNIDDDHFTWSLDRSFDKGKTWIRDAVVIENTRRKSTQR